MAITRDDVLWCYRLILGREPESESVVEACLKSRDLASLRASFFRSPEFLKEAPSARSAQCTLLPLDLPNNPVEYNATATQLADCIAKIKASWSHLGITKPHFSVLTNQKFLPENLSENEGAFWSSGEEEAGRVEKMLARHDFTALSTRVCVEYGCGVGRVTEGLARRFARVHGYDISQGHLSLALQRSQETGVSNCQFHLCSDNLLEQLEPCDFFYSRIVFQHNPPPVIYQLIRNALRALNPNGIAIFQVPTYRLNYRFSISEWLATEHVLDMQMHCLPQHVVFSIIADENCGVLEVREDGSTGALDKYISNMFVVRKHE